MCIHSFYGHKNDKSITEGQRNSLKTGLKVLVTAILVEYNFKKQNTSKDLKKNTNINKQR
jgi:hypothetical protein